MGKRTTRSGSSKPARQDPAPPPWPAERHSGEGSASVLETLHKLEQRRIDSQPADPPKDEEQIP